MAMLANSAMGLWLDARRPFSLSKRLPKHLEQILLEGFSSVDGCTFFKSVQPPEVSAMLANTDRTNLEATYNKLHMTDYCPTDYSFDEVCYVGFDFGTELSATLSVYSSQAPFVVVLFMSDKEVPNCNVRFYEKRNYEAPYLVDDLNYYSQPVATFF